MKNKKKHPTYAVASFFHVTHGKPTVLNGSSIKHSNTIELEIREAEEYESLTGRKGFYGGKIICRIEMSYTQFAELISHPGNGTGIPVTLRYREGKNITDDVPYENPITKHKDKFDSHIDKTYEKTNNLISDLQKLFSEKKTLNKSDKEKILSALQKIKYDIGENAKFLAQEFNEQMENTVTESKGEIEAFFENKIYQIANDAIANSEKVNGIPVIFGIGNDK